MPAQLLALNDGPAILLDKPILLLGRDLECDIRLDSRKISRRHCCIAQVGDRLVVRDLGSTNGVRVNGNRVIEGTLKPGDELTIGTFRYKVYWGDGVPSSVHAAPVGEMKEAGRDSEKPQSTDGQPDEDELLEECDEPVPLKDPEEKMIDVPRARSVPPPTPAPPQTPKPEGPPPPPNNQGTQILPDELELAPQSDVLPKLPKSDHDSGVSPANP
jgi:predicted component of type VI protein secretion system